MNILENFSLAHLTTYRIGGPARWYARIADLQGVKEAFAWAKAAGVEVFVLGGGSNVLVDDDGFPGLVVKLCGGLGEAEVDLVCGVAVAGAGMRLKRLGRILTGQGYGDFLFATGIPGTVGGAVAGNAGTREKDVASVCEWVEVFDPARGVARLTREELSFGYRSSLFSRDKALVVVRACFRLGDKVEPVGLKRKVREHLLERADREPRNRFNCGSVFKAASDGTPAGVLIERAGLKGVRIGNAMIANEHANWIVNLGGATAAEVRSLIDLARGRVLEIFGVDLEREVVYVPDVPVPSSKG